jgi:hypothetical protein
MTAQTAAARMPDPAVTGLVIGFVLSGEKVGFMPVRRRTPRRGYSEIHAIRM